MTRTSRVVVSELTLAATRDTIRILAWLKSNAPQTKVVVVANRVPSGGALEISRKDFEQSIERPGRHRLPGRRQARGPGCQARQADGRSRRRQDERAVQPALGHGPEPCERGRRRHRIGKVARPPRPAPSRWSAVSSRCCRSRSRLRQRNQSVGRAASARRARVRGESKTCFCGSLLIGGGRGAGARRRGNSRAVGVESAQAPHRAGEGTRTATSSPAAPRPRFES